MAYLWSLKCRLFYLRIQECTNMHDYSQNKLEFTQKERTEDFKSWHFVQNHFVVPMWLRGKGKVLEPANGPYTRWWPTTSSSPALLARHSGLFADLLTRQACPAVGPSGQQYPVPWIFFPQTSPSFTALAPCFSISLVFTLLHFFLLTLR